MQANFIENDTRGRFLTLEIVITAVCAAIAVSVATYSLAVWHTFLPAALLACAFICLSSVAVIKLLADLPRETAASYKSVFANFKSLKFRKDRIAYTGFGFNMGFNNVVVALLVFFVVDSLKVFGTIMATIFIVEMLLTLIYGHFIDKKRLASNKLASLLQTGTYAFFILAVSPFLVAFIKTVYDLGWNIFDSSFTARFHQKIMNQGLVYACTKEVALGLSCAMYCGVLSLTAYVFTARAVVFAASLTIAAIGVVIAWKNFRD